MPEDKANFTQLVRTLRESLGKDKVISFAAGGFEKFIKNSIDWKEVMPLVDNVNLMTYDLVNGDSKLTGHHTPVYSAPQQALSADAAISLMIKMGVPSDKIVIGAAFYARVWKNVENANNGLFQSGEFKQSLAYSQFEDYFTDDFILYWDSLAQAPYRYSPEKKEFATFDNVQSLIAKTQYAEEKNLNGIMFWEMTHDTDSNELLETIYNEAIKK